MSASSDVQALLKRVADAQECELLELRVEARRLLGIRASEAPPAAAAARIRFPDGLMDRMIDDLSARGGYQRGYTSPLNLARWDLAAVLNDHATELAEVLARRKEASAA